MSDARLLFLLVLLMFHEGLLAEALAVVGEAHQGGVGEGQVAAADLVGGEVVDGGDYSCLPCSSRLTFVFCDFAIFYLLFCDVFADLAVRPAVRDGPQCPWLRRSSCRDYE